MLKTELKGREDKSAPSQQLKLQLLIRMCIPTTTNSSLRSRHRLQSAVSERQFLLDIAEVGRTMMNQCQDAEVKVHSLMERLEPHIAATAAFVGRRSNSFEQSTIFKEFVGSRTHFSTKHASPLSWFSDICSARRLAYRIELSKSYLPCSR